MTFRDLRERWRETWLADHLSAVEATLWVIQIIPAFMLGWIYQVPYVSFLSIWACARTAWSSHLARQAQREAHKARLENGS